MTTEPSIAQVFDVVSLIQEKIDRFIDQQSVREYYSTEEFADQVGLEPKTVRDNLNAGRLQGVKRRDGHGRSKRWTVPHEELLRYRREGLLPRQK